MPSLNEIRQKTEGIRSTQQITKAMKMIAGARLTRAQKLAAGGQACADGCRAALAGVLRGGFGGGGAEMPEDLRPLLSGWPGGATGMVVVTGDKGLCGGFNNAVIREAEDFRARAGSGVLVFAVGRKAQDHYRRAGVAMRAEFPGIPAQDDVVPRRLAETLCEAFMAERLGKVVAFSQESKSALKQTVVMRQLLPVGTGKSEEEASIPSLFEPAPAELCRYLIAFYLRTAVSSMIRISYAAELAARMSAMDNASRNAQKLIEENTLYMNNLRQASITRELSEIVGAGEVLR